MELRGTKDSRHRELRAPCSSLDPSPSLDRRQVSVEERVPGGTVAPLVSAKNTKYYLRKYISKPTCYILKAITLNTLRHLPSPCVRLKVVVRSDVTWLVDD